MKQLINVLPFVLKRASKKNLVSIFEFSSKFAHSDKDKEDIAKTVWRLKNDCGTLNFFKRVIDEVNPQCMKKFFANITREIDTGC